MNIIITLNQPNKNLCCSYYKTNWCLPLFSWKPVIDTYFRYYIPIMLMLLVSWISKLIRPIICLLLWHKVGLQLKNVSLKQHTILYKSSILSDMCFMENSQYCISTRLWYYSFCTEWSEIHLAANFRQIRNACKKLNIFIYLFGELYLCVI